MPEPGAGYDTVRIWAFQNDKYDWHTFDLDRDMPIINKQDRFVDAVEPGPQQVQGARRQAAAVCRVERHDNHAREHGALLRQPEEEDGAEQDDFVRLFMVPGMAHCRGGDGPNTFDAIGSDGGLARERRDAYAVDGLQPADEPDAADLLLSAVHEIQGHRERQGCRQLDVCGAVTFPVASAFRRTLPA